MQLVTLYAHYNMYKVYEETNFNLVTDEDEEKNNVNDKKIKR